MFDLDEGVEAILEDLAMSEVSPDPVVPQHLVPRFAYLRTRGWSHKESLQSAAFQWDMEDEIIEARWQWWFGKPAEYRRDQRKGLSVNTALQPKALPGSSQPKELMYDEGDECGVCLEPLKNGITPPCMTECYHWYHFWCIHQAYEMRHKCPTCRYTPLLVPAFVKTKNDVTGVVYFNVSYRRLNVLEGPQLP